MKPDDFEKNFFTHYVAVRYLPGALLQALDHIEKVWDKFVPVRPFEYKVLSAELDNLYREEVILGRLTGILTLLIIIIATLGLYGLASYTIDQRTREIGIRMVLGATLRNILSLLSKEFNRLILISIVIAWPLSFLLMHYWLQHFSYRTPIKFGVFILAGLIAFLITLMISVYKAISSYLSKPVNTLKYE
jgi:putative ABC transport system permease protein